MPEFLLYKKFKTITEMIYVIEKAYTAKERWTEAQRQTFEKGFAENLLEMQKNRKFQKEYALYEEAVAQGEIIMSPQNARQMRLNKVLKEIECIKLACQPYRLDNKEVWRKQADTRLKYEKRLRNNMLDIKLFKDKEREW